ncbi:uncharacterized protein PAC_01235 [Phialocephala subalpina]|uniref:Uncharacterized protein n=1 Tax=Phialocephala subalpina TaxID=576137 RepID=A0A1L7WF04_9HELO|nr:uncharacterized protein PAC_01235 [Phialocephala subalpina]
MAFGTTTAGNPKWWPAWVRYTVLANLCWFVFMGNCYVSGITTGFEQIAEEFRVGFGSLTSIVYCFGAGSVESLGPSMIADLFLERYFATAMALFALFLSRGSQIVPVIAGYLIAEISYRRPYVYGGETAAKADKEATQMIKNKQDKSIGDDLASIQTGTAPSVPYAGSYWKDLVSFRNRGQKENSLRAFPKQLTLPWRFLLVPGALYAAISYGVILGGIVIISS